jgi:hypothetical protein
MRTLPLFLAAAALAVVPASPARAASLDLFESVVNVDGTIADSFFGDPLPAGVSMAGFDTMTGLGTVSVTVNTAGDHFVGLWVDHEIDQFINTFSNENGATTNMPAMGQTWEIDEPGFSFGDIWNNIYLSDNVGGSALDNSNGVPAGMEDDVSMALGWDYTLAAGQTAAIDFLVSETMPASGFYLTQTDPDSNYSIYFSSTLDIRTPGAGVIPEPTTWVLYGMGLGLAAVAGLRRRQRMEV